MSQSQKKAKGKAKGKAKDKDKSKSKDKPSIPTAGQGKPSQRSNVLARFAKKAKPKTKKVAKKDRPKLPIPEAVQEKYRNYAPVKHLTDLLVAKNKQMAKELAEECWEIYLDFLWSKQKAPETPKLEARREDGKVDSEGQFMVQQGSKIRVKLPPMEEGDDLFDAFVAALVNQGVDEEDAQNFVEAELDLTPQFNIPITTLCTGDDDLNRSAAEKVLCWVNGQDEDGDDLEDPDAPLVLTAAEKEALAEYIDDNSEAKPSLIDPANFLDRICNYFSTNDDIKAVLTTVAVPDHFLSRTKFGVSSSESEKVDRLSEEASKIIGQQ
jgi:hypothetical protein